MQCLAGATGPTTRLDQVNSLWICEAKTLYVFNACGRTLGYDFCLNHTQIKSCHDEPVTNTKKTVPIDCADRITTIHIHICNHDLAVLVSNDVIGCLVAKTVYVNKGMFSHNIFSHRFCPESRTPHPFNQHTGRRRSNGGERRLTAARPIYDC